MTAKKVHFRATRRPGELSFFTRSGHSLTESRMRPSPRCTRSIPALVALQAEEDAITTAADGQLLGA